MQNVDRRPSFMRKLLTFFVPMQRKALPEVEFSEKRIVAVIPTYRPEPTTYRLVKNLITWHKNVSVIIVDDHTPEDASKRTITNIKALAAQNKRVVYLRTAENKLKAGATNEGIEYAGRMRRKPHVVVTFDDDVIINTRTIPEMVKALYTYPKCGVVCSMALVANKNVNLLTRLQALEYHSFNVVKLADTGFLKGPLVMHGMLSAFRYEAIAAVKGFRMGHLIEDYDITVRLKNAGWNAGFAPRAEAWTEVPTSFSVLWRQRVRWSYWGIHVVHGFYKTVQAVFQDLVGHIAFISLIALIALSFILQKNGNLDGRIVSFFIILAFIQFFVAFIFQIFTLLWWGDADRTDWLIRLTFIPEFLYSNVLSLVLLGSYAFYAYNSVSGFLTKRFSLFAPINAKALKAFSKLGYSTSWGTRGLS